LFKQIKYVNKLYKCDQINKYVYKKVSKFIILQHNMSVLD